MVWTNGVIGVFEPVSQMKQKLDEFHIETEDQGETLDNYCRIEPIEFQLKDNTLVLHGMAMYEFVKNIRQIVKTEDGQGYRLTADRKVVDADWGFFWLATKSIVVVDKQPHKYPFFQILSSALTGDPEHIQPVEFNIQEIAKDYPGHWTGSFRDRENNIQSGVFYGDQIDEDSEMGPAYIASQKNQVGIITEEFGAPVKVKITRAGTVLVYKNLSSEMGQYIDFVKDILLPYAI